MIPQANPAGNTTHRRYDEHGRLIEVTNPNGHSRRLTYDEAGRLTALTNENTVATCFAWDELDRLSEEHGIDERTRRHRYNAADELIEIEETSAGQTRSFRFEHDKAGRLIARSLPASESAPAQVAVGWGEPANPNTPSAAPAQTAVTGPIGTYRWIDEYRQSTARETNPRLTGGM